MTLFCPGFIGKQSFMPGGRRFFLGAGTLFAQFAGISSR
jgi:hypothetical protein